MNLWFCTSIANSKVPGNATMAETRAVVIQSPRSAFADSSRSRIEIAAGWFQPNFFSLFCFTETDFFLPCFIVESDSTIYDA